MYSISDSQLISRVYDKCISRKVRPERKPRDTDRSAIASGSNLPLTYKDCYYYGDEKLYFLGAAMAKNFVFQKIIIVSEFGEIAG